MHCRPWRWLAIAVALAAGSTFAQAQPAASGAVRGRRSGEYRVVVSLADRRLWVLLGEDTLLAAPVAVGSSEELEYEGRRWDFDTPRGTRVVLSKTENAEWVPPDWHYVEAAATHGLRLAWLGNDRPVRLTDGRTLEVRDSTVGVVELDSTFAVLPRDEEIVFDSTLFIPPLNTKNRHVAGELGRYQLDLGDGYMLHGTPYLQSIGTASSHGCIRLRDRDVEWLYDNVPVRTRVYIY